MQENKKTAVISGALGDIGKATAKAFAQDGYNVILLYHTTKDSEVKKFVSSLEKGRHRAVVCDLTSEKSVKKAADIAKKQFGTVDVCVHCAVGKIERKHILEFDRKSLDKQLAVGFFGGFALFREIVPLMSKGSAIVAVTSSSIEDKNTGGRMGAYNIGKYALKGLVLELARDLLPRGIRVNAVAPNFMDTKLNNDLPRKVAEFAAEKNPSKKLVTPAEVASGIVFLCSDACHQTGTTLSITGAT